MELFGGKIRADFDYYEKVTSDLLLPFPVSIITGLNNVTANIGELKNNGYEVILGATLADKDDLSWDVEFQLARNTRGGEALSLIRVDDELPLKVLKEIRNQEGITSACKIVL